MKLYKKNSPVLLISSGGGHWLQLLRIRPAWESENVVYASVNSEYNKIVFPAPYYVISDGNIKSILSLLKLSISILVLIIKVKPRAIITTGAAPGFFALLFGKIIGSKTMWIDSIANAEELSLSGKKVKKYADHWLTQWENITTDDGPYFQGRIL